MARADSFPLLSSPVISSPPRAPHSDMVMGTHCLSPLPPGHPCGGSTAVQEAPSKPLPLLLLKFLSSTHGSGLVGSPASDLRWSHV